MKRFLILTALVTMLIAPTAFACYFCEDDTCRCWIVERGSAQCGCACDEDVPLRWCIHWHCTYADDCGITPFGWTGTENSATSGQYAAAGVWFLSPDARADVEDRIAVATNGLPSVSAELLARDLYREAFRAEAITIRPRRHHPRNSIASRVLLPRYMLVSPTIALKSGAM